MTISYKYNEDEVLQEIKKYVDATYAEHYSGKYQATDMIIDAGHGTGFCIGNIMKYAKRYGKKGGSIFYDGLGIRPPKIQELKIMEWYPMSVIMEYI